MDFVPPFCPYSECSMHTRDQNTPSPAEQLTSHLEKQNTTELWYAPHGSYCTRAFGRVSRFRCLHCGRTFSAQTFSIDYYAKRTVNYRTLEFALTASVNLRRLARYFSVTTGTIGNKVARLSRQALAMHTRLTADLPLSEDLVADGFESYTVSKYFPEDINLLVGKHSQFLYEFNQVTFRRKGRMTEAQKDRRRILYEKVNFPQGGIYGAFCRLTERLQAWLSTRIPKSGPAVLYTDEKQQYLWALQTNDQVRHWMEKGLFLHATTPSTDPRTVHNDLFSVNYMDRELRKDIAAYHRKSVCHARNLCDQMNRLAMYFCWHNYGKNHRIDNSYQPAPVHAEKAGADRQKIEDEWDNFFKRRAFLSREQIEGFWRQVWLRELDTPLKERDELVPAYVMM